MIIASLAVFLVFHLAIMSSSSNGNNSGGNRTTFAGGRGGGRGKPQNKPQNKPSQGSNNAPSKKPDKATRKKGKRALQLAAMEKKAEAEDAYFRQCQREAARAQNPASGMTEKELFAAQGAQGINFQKYDDIKVDVKLPNNANVSVVAALKHFNGLSEALTPQLQANIVKMRYAMPTPIQRHAIPHAMNGHDLMCCAQTGSGKTCAFLLPICAALAKTTTPSTTINKPANGATNGNTKTPCSPSCVVLAPTRELASQIELEAQKLTFGLREIRPVAVYGGTNQRKQLRDLAFGANIIVATPGRLTDFVERSLVSLEEVNYLILDEADRMLDMGFEPQIRRLVLQSNMKTKEAGRQTLMFSATFPGPIQKLAGAFMRPYVWIAVGRVGSTTASITQVLVKAESHDKRKKLKLVVDAIQKGPNGRTLVFVQKKRTATWVKKQLVRGGNVGEAKPEDLFTPIEAEDIHGDRTQSQREKALAAFRAGIKCTVLVATDVAARGLDISGVEHVINMDLPTAKDDFDSYVHRIGRTGRAGHTGLATSLYVSGDAPGGNSKIASVLVTQLREAKQQVPAWLDAECVVSSKAKSSKGTTFGGTDVRGNSSGGRGGGGGGQQQRNNNGGGRNGNSGGGRGKNGGGRGGGGRGGGGRGGGGRGSKKPA